MVKRQSKELRLWGQDRKKLGNSRNKNSQKKKRGHEFWKIEKKKIKKAKETLKTSWYTAYKLSINDM